ncbi:hypothetical protein [Fodinibius sp. SL11]|uniref:hypothetical protein n=1 Tax=Fodinibius sp. SL11 TaxID=3425690 RepID=UPI003F882A1A
MNLSLRKILYSILLIGVSIVCFLFGSYVNGETQKEIYINLIRISGIVFGIMGAWIAIVFSNSIKIIFSSEVPLVDKKAAYDNIEHLLIPMYLSTLVIISSLIYLVAYPVVKSLPFFQPYSDMLQSISFAWAGVMLMLQLLAILYIFVPGERIKRKATKTIKEDEVHDKLNSNSKTIRKSIEEK